MIFDAVVVRIEVDIGVVGSRPVNAVIWEYDFLCGDGALFRAFWTNGIMSGYSSGCVYNSEKTEWR